MLAVLFSGHYVGASLIARPTLGRLRGLRAIDNRPYMGSAMHLDIALFVGQVKL